MRSSIGPVLAAVDDDSRRVGNAVEVPPREREADVVVAAAEVGGVVEECVADFDVAAVGIDHRRDAEHVGRGLAVFERRARDLVEAGEERDVEIRPVEPRAVAGRNGGGGADDRVVHPHAVLEHERDQAGRDRQIERGVAAGPAADHVAEVAFEEGRVGVGIEEIESR